LHEIKAISSLLVSLTGWVSSEHHSQSQILYCTLGSVLKDNAIVPITVGMLSGARQCGHCIWFSVNGSLMTLRAPGIGLY